MCHNHFCELCPIASPQPYLTQLPILSEVHEKKYDLQTVMFITGMGDLIVWEDEFTVQLNFRTGESEIIESDLTEISFEKPSHLETLF